MERLSLGKMQNPIRGLLHGTAAVAALAGTVYLVVQAWGRASAVASAVVFGSALVVMYVVSTIYHSVPWRADLKQRLQRVDHSMIYLVVAGTYTPIAVAALDGAELIGALALVWTMGIVGIILKLALPWVSIGLSVTLQISMGASVVLWLPDIARALGWAAIALIVAGGLLYIAGVVIWLTKRPRLLPRTFSYHELFHALVVAASALHFIVVARYAIPVA